MYKIQNKSTGEWFLYSYFYDGVAWIEPERLHKYYEDSFLFTFGQVDDLIANLLSNVEVDIFLVLQ